MTNNNLVNPENLILSIQVSLDGFSFYIKDTVTNTLVACQEYFFKNSGTPQKSLEEIQKVFSTTPSLNHTFKEVVVIYANELFAIVPKVMFNEQNLTDYLKFNTKILKTDFIVYDEIEELDLINVYVPYANINNFFFDHFGTFTYYHSQSILIKNILSQTSSTDNAEIFIQVSPQAIDLISYQKKKLLLNNHFKYETPDDFVYYILFCFEQLQLSTETTKLWLNGSITEEDATYKLIYEYVRDIAFYSSESNKILKNSFLQYSISL
ncbi:DUF3822 family protein [Leeuwenhoekiella marinoflava]|uniref:DUF3822 family protein n=2 Tax=Leeuwenhoekiella marinoflava TaxID=988 RepID=A0A4Q0PQK3_9FLAO|nr:DUF3822 family protein [Leeuwenhoekiella marinoflava]RXG32807.1 putative protein DUF3822 [Leeuwenhoekiella marinoflava]SHE57440.1 Protein of unknown function [Leeuwenhoekiella marinoflava DSM 3653]